MAKTNERGGSLCMHAGPFFRFCLFTKLKLVHRALNYITIHNNFKMFHNASSLFKLNMYVHLGQLFS